MWVLLWQETDGSRKWEAVKDKQIESFLEKLLNDGIHPATVMCAYSPILFHWVWKKFHNGRSDVYFQNIDKEIYGTEPIANNHKPVRVPEKKREPETKYGWLSPDGRYFKCEYGGHSNLADRICGDLEHISDPERHLEDLGWVKILNGGSFTGKKYALGMGIDKKLTDSQMKRLVELGLDSAWGIEFLL